jgi:hypothetical protein
MILGPARRGADAPLAVRSARATWSIFVTHGISALLLGLTVVILIAPSSSAISRRA